MDKTLILLVISALVIGVVLAIFIRLTPGRGQSLDQTWYRSQWMEIMKKINDGSGTDFQLAILQADKLLDKALRERGVRGQTMGERMKAHQAKWTNANAVWSAHKLRNQIAHEADVTIDQTTARRAAAGFKQALKTWRQSNETPDDAVLAQYEMTIGIECHVQLATATKLFSAADNDARDKAPNSVVSAVDYGLPGMLPVLNKEAVHSAIKAGKALNAGIALESRFDRKHYFYPDLPKGYQTTQMYQPIIEAGIVHAPLDDGSEVAVRIHHAHMEEDAGKLTHYADYSLVDLNRAGTPLIEIVSEPDIHSPAEARLRC